MNKKNVSDIYSMDRTEYLEKRQQYWENVQNRWGDKKTTGSFYQKKLQRYYRFFIPENQKVLELGCGTGDLLISLKPSYGVGIDFSRIAITKASEKASEHTFFICESVENIMEIIDTEICFDYVIFSDLINDLWDVQDVLEQIRPYCRRNTRIILNFYSRLWQLPLSFGQKIGQAKPLLQQNWFTTQDVVNILHISGFDTLKRTSEFIFPFNIPLIEQIFNRFLARIYPFKLFDLVNIIIARPIGKLNT